MQFIVLVFVFCFISMVNLEPCHANDSIVRIETSKGPILIRVFTSMVPQTSASFLDLVSRGFYTGKIFHRVENWCIQGGDPNGNGTGSFIDPQTGRPRYLKLEINRNLSHNGPGVVAMARSQNLNSASCQFYITKRDMRQLDGNYSIFGRVINGLNTVNAIRPGDQILSAQLVSNSNSQPSTRSPGYSSQNSVRSNQTSTPSHYVPPSAADIPDSGF